MKYNSNNKPLVCYQTQSTCYKGTQKMEVKGILWHTTGAANPYLKRYVQPSETRPPEDTYSREEWLALLGQNAYGNDWNHIEYKAGLNCWIGKLADGTITTVQTMPWNYRPWGCGSGKKGSCNDGWIQFEIEEPDDLNDPDYFAAVYREACEITAYLCDMYGITPGGTCQHNGITVPNILCHYDAYSLKLGTNHSDVYAWFNKHGKDMVDVRNDVIAIMNGTIDNVSTPNATETEKGDDNMRYFRITDPTGMNMRTAPNKTKIQCIPCGAVISGTEFQTLKGTDWLYTTYNGQSGYVAVLPESKGYAVECTDEYIKPADPEPTPEEPIVEETPSVEIDLSGIESRLDSLGNDIASLSIKNQELIEENTKLREQIVAAEVRISDLELKLASVKEIL